MDKPPSRRVAGVAAVALTLVVAGAAVLLTDRISPWKARVPLGVGEVVDLGPNAGERLRLVAVATERDGRYTAIFEPDGAHGRSGQLRLTDDAPLVVGERTLRLFRVALDSTRGSAVQFQWIPDDLMAPRPLFSVGEEAVRLPVEGEDIHLAIDGPIPAPGHGSEVELVVTERFMTERHRLTRGEPWRLYAGTLTWMGTRERLLVWIEIR